MTPKIRQLPAGWQRQGSAPAGQPSDRAEALAWLRGELQWERRLTEVRRAYNETASVTELVPDERGAADVMPASPCPPRAPTRRRPARAARKRSIVRATGTPAERARGSVPR